MADRDAHDGIGHRERLRERVLEEADGLLDHELLEYLLMLAVPRIDTKPVAHRLIREFGSYAAVLTADTSSLMRVPGVGDRSAAAIKVAHASAIRLLRPRERDRPVLAGWQALMDYLHADMAHRDIERVRVLYLDTKNRLLRDELAQEGTVDQAPIYVREVIRRAMDLGAVALILVHNHPSGDPQPSRQDIALTREVINAGRPLGIAVHDHVIVGSSGHASMKAMGLI